MYKKMTLTILITIALSVLSSPSFAANRDILYDSSTPSTSQFMVTITRPEGDESTFKKDYVICANTDQDDVVISVLKYNKQMGVYRPINGSDANSTWEIGRTGIFVKQIELPKVGTHPLRVVAYKKNEISRLELHTNLQVNNYTVTLLDRGIKDVIKSGFFRLSDMLSQLMR